MDVHALCDRVLALLQQRGRVSYRELKRRLGLDDASFADLKEALLFGNPSVVELKEPGLVWTGARSAAVPEAGALAADDRQFQLALFVTIALLQREQRVTYRTLQNMLDVDEACLHAVRDELRFRELAREEGGQGLVWLGEKPAPAAIGATPATAHSGAHSASELAPAVAAAAERRQLTVMFCDLVGSTDLSGRLDPEYLREVVRAYQETAATAIQRYEGHIAQYLGDGLLVYFGYPLAHEDDAHRAVHTALGIIEGLDALNTRLQADYGVKLAVRLGIHTGPVVVGQMGAAGRHEQLALGETPNIAARLEGLASPNAVVISPVTARIVADSFALEAMGPQTLKGVAAQMEVWRVAGVRERHPEPLEGASAAAGAAPLVGRDEEIGLLRRRREQSRTGQGQVVLVSGEAGIGKSVLVEGLRAQARAEGAPRITFRASPYHTNSALYCVTSYLERTLQFAPEDDAAARVAKMEAGLQPLGLPLADMMPLYAALLSVPLPAERYAPLAATPQQLKQRTLDALLAWLTAEAERQPVMVTWEDLHWADPTTLELLGMVIAEAPTVPILHVLTYRPAFTPPWPPQSHFTPIVLGRLERAQVEALIALRAKHKALPPEVVRHIADKTDGVPLYVEELTRMLLSSALLREEADRYVLVGPLDSAAIPDTLQDALMARLDRLPQVRELAQLCSVLGREFAYELISGIAIIGETLLQEGLGRLVEAELFYQRGRPPRAKYSFKHALIQDAAYGSLLRRTRQQVHLQVAQLLEARFPETVETHPELVAHHYSEANVPDLAINYFQKAGARALRMSANSEAIAHLTKGLEILRTMPEGTERARRELNLLMTMGPALIASRGYAAAEVELAYRRAIELCQELGDAPLQFSVLHGMWLSKYMQGNLLAARSLAAQLVDLAEARPDPGLDLMAHRTLGYTLESLGELQAALSAYERAIASYDPAVHGGYAFRYGGADPGSGSMCHGGWTLFALGHPDQALARNAQGLALARKLAHPFSEVWALISTAVVHHLRGDPKAILEHAEAAIEIAKEKGFAYFLGLASFLRGHALFEQGGGAEAIAEMRRGIDACRATGAILGVPYFLALLASAHGRHDYHQARDGLAMVAEGLAEVARTGERFWEPELHRLKGQLLLQNDTANEREAETCFRNAIEIARSQGARCWELRAATSLARLWSTQDKQAEAHDLLSEIHGWFSEGFDTADLLAAGKLLDLMNGTQGAPARDSRGAQLVR